MSAPLERDYTPKRERYRVVIEIEESFLYAAKPEDLADEWAATVADAYVKDDQDSRLETLQIRVQELDS